MGTENNSGENPSEELKKLSQEEPDKTGLYGPVRQERRKGHQLVSTAAYYRNERRGMSGASYGEPQDWADGDMESDGTSYSDTNF